MSATIATLNIVKMSRLVLIYLYIILLPKVMCIFSKITNYTIYEVTTFNARERALLYYIYVRNEMMIFMNGITNEAGVPMDIVVDECYTKIFEEKLNDNDIEYIKIPQDKLIRKLNEINIELDTYPYTRVPNITNAFYSWDTLNIWIEIKLRKFPILSKIKLTKTYMEKEIYVLKLSTGKKDIGIFLLGGEDGKDWLSPAILLNFIDYFIEQKHNVDLLLKHYDFYIVPVLNPDGYDYNIKTDWSWGRNRRTYFPKKMCTKNQSAIGINLDRNWYLTKDTIRDEECDPVYSGAKSLSEEETSSLSRFLDSIALKMMVFINLRGFERLITIPYGYNNEYSNNYPVLMDILSSVHDRVMEEHEDAEFFYGPTSTYFYNFTGNVADWVKKKLNTPVVLTIYMKTEGFIFPSATDIIPLTNQFSTILKETLMLASSMYSPLFGNQIRISLQSTTILMSTFIHLICI